MKSITFFMHNVYAMGGTVKSISQLANTLAEKGHQVTIISVFKSNDYPYFQLHESIKIKPLINYQLRLSNLWDIIFNRINKYTSFTKPKELSKFEPGLNQFSHYIEKKMIHALKHVDTDVIIGTRASFNILIAQHVPTHIETIGMEHMNLDAHPEPYQLEIISAYKNLDKVTTLTTIDREKYQSRLQTPVFVVPNIIDEPRLYTSKSKIITAAGRLEYEKGFDLLIDSINPIQHTIRQFGYQVFIYGEGQERSSLQKQINTYAMTDIIKLQGSTQELNNKLAMSEITVIPSRNEGFGMVILEAMNQSNIVVSFDGNTGPDSIIENNINGYLIEHGNIEALSNKLRRLINQEFKEHVILKNAHKTVEQYTPQAIYNDFLKMLNSH
ncbi:glycosyltransferase family 4 protein [Staphylococcus gallinarum]|uniref:glycosyltransferase family 4 protein n=1 Tax=Staphylococcus gallinarum TaxID=1293 RepID=UPI001E4B140D|nr:glycosyltransferase family 4 protein [Staphylococcus gallinarum]MCD8900102.1 glycosyltransferase family 4 protein [Staphylococcus gallinarum]MCD8903326.1 glycosyltransferase family 4 protein [Staphylococcus gallinarum]MCD8920416.1 glycosyltransferase family 4 protein [Staphylococcus gallinarum]MEB6237842.1 glycosyltransferase family 4 protein [Staphylococcus gallinarum]MEB6278462.1 glycosyltransferase family 4 protein [Staphylococcus gallinarum]